MLRDGLTCDKLRSLHKNVFRKKWPTFSLHQPFLKNMPQNASDFWSRMEGEASRPAQGMVIAIVGGGIDHWSVVREITDEKIVLFDSYYEELHPLRRDCGYSKEDAPKYVIWPGCVLLIRSNT